jgi:hypothetical protein
MLAPHRAAPKDRRWANVEVGEGIKSAMNSFAWAVGLLVDRGR